MRLKIQKQFTILDSNFLVALIDEKDNVLDCVVNEVISVLAKRFQERGDVEFREVLEELEKRIPKSNLDVVKQYNGKLNFHDALILIVMTTAGLEYIVSFDEDFDLLEGCTGWSI